MPQDPLVSIRIDAEQIVNALLTAQLGLGVSAGQATAAFVAIGTALAELGPTLAEPDPEGPQPPAAPPEPVPAATVVVRSRRAISLTNLGEEE